MQRELYLTRRTQSRVGQEHRNGDTRIRCQKSSERSAKIWVHEEETRVKPVRAGQTVEVEGKEQRNCKVEQDARETKP